MKAIEVIIIVIIDYIDIKTDQQTLKIYSGEVTFPRILLRKLPQESANTAISLVQNNVTTFSYFDHL